MSIFVQMTSFGGFDVEGTVNDCLDRAKNRDAISFGIALQQDSPAPQLPPNARVDVSPIGEFISHGEARRRTQQMYSGQDHVLQIEAGCRFSDGWDEELVSTLERLGGKSLITNFAGKIGPNWTRESTVAYRPQVYQFLSDTPAVWPAPLKNVPAPVRGRYVVDHFFFTRGSHCTECQYDREIYYSEAEAYITLLSFTSGYDIYHHNKPLVWREYGRRPAPWESDRDWWFRQHASRRALSRMVREKRGLGGVRTLRDYELYSGIDFENRRIQKDTAAGASEPPNRYENEGAWVAGYMKDFNITVNWNPDEVEKCDDYDYWYFSIEDATGSTLVRQDVRREREAPILDLKTNFRRVMFKAPADKVPKFVCIWPVSKSRGWLKKSKFAI